MWNTCSLYLLLFILLRQRKLKRRFGRSHHIFRTRKMWKMKNRMFCEMIVFEVNKWWKYFPLSFVKIWLMVEWVTYDALYFNSKFLKFTFNFFVLKNFPFIFDRSECTLVENIRFTLGSFKVECYNSTYRYIRCTKLYRWWCS